MTPKVHVCTPPTFDSESLCIQFICEKNGGGTVVGMVTITVTVTVWVRLPLVPVTLTK